MHPSFFVGLIASLLPPAMRPKIIRDNAEDLRAPAILSGIVQLLICLVLLIVRYPRFVHAQQDAMSTTGQLRAVEIGGETALAGLGVIFLIAYVLSPLSIVLEYFAFEGVVRGVAALINGEPVGTLPLYLLLLAKRKAEEEIKEHELGPRIPDEVTAIGTEESEAVLKVASCRPKDWNSSITISYADELYEVAQSFEEQPPRRFVYLLRKAPKSKVVRGLRNYDPQEVLVETPE